MFFVITFNSALGEFEYIGAFSKREEAEAFANANVDERRLAPFVHETTFKAVIEHATTARLGEMAKVFERLTSFASKVESVTDGKIVLGLSCDTAKLCDALAETAVVVGGIADGPFSFDHRPDEQFISPAQADAMREMGDASGASGEVHVHLHMRGAIDSGSVRDWFHDHAEHVALALAKATRSGGPSGQKG